MKSDLMRFATGVALMAVLASCSPSSENSLLSSDPNDPNSHTMNTDPTATDLQMVADTYNQGSITSTGFLELSGACFASTYPTHRITVTVNNAASTIYDMSGNSQMTYGTCRNGRFDVVLKGSLLKTGTNAIVLTLTGYDSNSVAATSGNAVARYTAIRSN